MARVGIGSKRGLAWIKSRGERRMVVSLGLNDGAEQAGIFRRRVRLALQGRDCVAWILMPARPELDRILRNVARTDGRLVPVVSSDIPRTDLYHPTPTGYKRLARRARAAAKTCRGHALADTHPPSATGRT